MDGWTSEMVLWWAVIWLFIRSGYNRARIVSLETRSGLGPPPERK